MAEVLAPLDEVAAAANGSPPLKRSGKSPAAHGGSKPQHSAQQLQQIMLLCAAFKVCSNPSTGHMHKLARRTSLTVDQVDQWFKRRRFLEDWCASPRGKT